MKSLEGPLNFIKNSFKFSWIPYKYACFSFNQQVDNLNCNQQLVDTVLSKTRTDNNLLNSSPSNSNSKSFDTISNKINQSNLPNNFYNLNSSYYYQYKNSSLYFFSYFEDNIANNYIYLNYR